MKSTSVKILSMLLSFLMLFQVAQPALAYRDADGAETASQAAEEIVLVDSEGNTTEIDESWDEAYPFGAFSFNVTAVEASEGDDTVVTVYRLGGTNGRATAYITYSPLLVPNEDGSAYYGYALSGDDVTIEVENPLPVAEYQPVGKLPAPEAGDAAIVVGTDDEGYVLSLSVEAEAYQWQVRYGGRWIDVGGDNGATLPMDGEYLDEYDFRCVYTVNGERYCTASLSGEAYEKEPEEVLKEMPADIELNPEPTFTALELIDPDDMYSGWIFSLTFAEGEWKKEIHIHANTDDAVECIEGATFMIAYTDGGEVYSGSETLLYHLNDVNESNPSTVGFTVETVDADKADGSVKLIVRREGGVERPVTVEYSTEDGTAKAGTDYVAASGTLMLYGNVTELPITVQLIDDQIAYDEARTFSVKISGLKGDDNCALTTDAATVSLVNSGTGDATNLASILYDSESVDVTSAVRDNPTAANGGTEAATGKQVKVDADEAEPIGLIPYTVDGGEYSTQSYEFDASQATLDFSGKGTWKNTENLAAKANFSKNGTSGNLLGSGDKTNELGGTNGGGYSDAITLDMGVALTGKTNCSAELNGDLASVGGQKYSSYIASVKTYYAHDTSYLDGFTYKYSWLVPTLNVKNGSYSLSEPSKTKREGSGPLNKSWMIYGCDTNDNDWANPYTSAYKGNFSSTGKVTVKLNMSYYSTASHEQDELNADSMVWLQRLIMTRRHFRSAAFSVDIATPNDKNTAPANCAEIKNYENYFPRVEIKTGGASNNNEVYVGSTITVTPGAVAGMSVSTVEVMSSTDGKTWTKFTKFTSSVKDGVYTITLVGTESNPLTVSEIQNNYFRFRVVYVRNTKITVNLATSLPRDAQGEPDSDEIAQLFNNYNGQYDHCFASASITYMQSIYDSSKADYSKTNTKDQPAGSPSSANLSGTKWIMPEIPQNVQWICFGLPKSDLLLVNGKAYPGDAKIYLTAEDMVGGLNIDYYHEKFQHFKNSMDLSFSWIGLYLDADGDEKISGSYDSETGLFMLDKKSDGKTTKDEFIRFVNDGDSLNELELQPVSLGGGKFGQYYLIICYNMTPRCLDVIEGEEDYKAQVLPAVITAVDPKSGDYSGLTAEQKKYNYVISGVDASGKHTSDGHEAFTAKAQAKQIVTVPLGGDKNPPQLNSAGTEYVWTPNWYENNLFSYETPRVPKTNNLSGKGVFVVPGSGWKEKLVSGTVICEFSSDSALKQMNGYLASLVGTSTVAIVSQIQKADTGTIAAAADKTEYAVKPDSVTVAAFSTVPDSSYLKENKDNSSANDSKTKMDSGGGKGKDGKESELQEFNMPFDMNFGSNEVGVTEYVTILFDDNSVGFAISIPLVAAEREGNQGEGKGFGTANKEAWTQYADFFKKPKLGDDLLKDAYDAKGTATKSVTSSKFSVKLSFCTAFMWQYNPLDNGYYFSAWEVGIAGELEFKAQARFTVFPPLYLYFDVKFAIELKTGLGVIRDAKDDAPIIDARTADKAANAVTVAHYSDNYEGEKFAPETYTFETNKKAFNIRFDGKLYMEIQVKRNGSWVEPSDSDKYIAGVISSDGTSETQVVFKQKDGMDLSETVRVVLTALSFEDDEEESDEPVIDKTKITYLAKIVGIYDFVHWNGIHIAPQLDLEIGAGIGVDLLKVELFIHPSIGAEFVLCAYNENYDPSLPKTTETTGNFMYYPASVESFSASIGIALRVVLVFFTYELEFVSYNIEYDGDDWSFGWSFLNGMVEADADDTDAGVTIRPPADKTASQTLYTPEDNLKSDFSTQAYDPNDPTVPFQVSGYGSSMDAANLSENIVPGTQYRVIRAGERSFVAYTISRTAPAAEDRTAIVLSELGYLEGGSGTAAYGLVNPVDPSSATPYIVLDNDLTGDLDLDLWVETGAKSGSDTPFTIHAVWTSYATPMATATAPTEPASAKYSAGGAEMNADNYKTIAAPSAPAEVTEPAETDYYTVSDTEPDPSTGWEESEGKWYKPASGYSSYAEAKAAYEAAQTAYGEYLTDKAAYDSAKAVYDEWYAYYESLDSYNAWMQNRVKYAADNTVVKAASWSFTETATQDGDSTIYTYSGGSGFSVPSVVNDNAAYDYVFMPATAFDGKAVFFGSTETGDDGTAYAAYSAYQTAKGLPTQVKNYQLATRKSLLDVQGTQSALNLALWNGSEWTVSKMALPEGQTLANAEFTKIGSDYYVAYTTEQTEYVRDGDTYTDMVTVYRLLLRKITISGSTVTWGPAYLLRENRDFDKNAGGTDGVYSGGSLKTGYDSPYLANLRFLTAKIDDTILTGAEEETFTTQAVTEQTILTFEMNGSTYVIAESSLKKITTEGKGTIYPFFVPPEHENADGTTATEGSSGKLQVNINVDGNGNIYAVYVGAAAGTTGNALYLSTYDASVNKWGDGVMLAMHDMDTYEASIRNDWDQNTAEAAYLYGGAHFKTAAGKAALEELYGAEAIAALDSAADHELGDGKTFTFSSVQTVQGAKGELLAVTMGSTQEMTYAEITDTAEKHKVLSPVYDENGLATTVGTYVVSFGQGSAALGKSSIGFASMDFNAGSSLYVTIDAENVGTSAFRGSESQPITATLTAGGQKLAEWEITENVISGQKLSLAGFTEPLANRLTDGAEFVLTITEDSSYTGSTQTESVTLFTVEEKPDLSVSELKVVPVSTSADGKTTTLDVSFIAGNNGSADATDVYAQFTYVSGHDANGDPIYKPLDLTDADLTVGPETLLSLLTTQEVSSDLANGKLALSSKDHNGNVNCNIAQGYGKLVSGTIEVPYTIFAADESEHASIRIELFSASSTMTTMDVGVITADHDEYCTANNSATEQFEAFTSFTASRYVVIPLGTTTKIPLSAISSRAEKPSITVSEINNEDGLNIGILNFKQSSASDGKISGVISITPTAVGTGVIHVTDTDTNTTWSIAFEVTEAEDGIDIFKDNKSFTFYNADGNQFDESGTEAGQNWAFPGTSTWGTTPETKETPLRSNLSVGDEGAYFTFDTVAEAIDLYFEGTVSVVSTNPDFGTANAALINEAGKVIVTNPTGGSSPTTISLGENPDNETFTVTIRVVSETASFDRLEETYAGNVVPTPSYDGVNPYFIWSRSFPDTASVAAGTTIPIKMYIVDNNGVAEVTVNAVQYTDPEVENDPVTSMNADQLLLCYDFGALAANANYDISAADISANVTSTTLIVDWFMDTPTGDTNTVPVPEYTAAFSKNGEPLGDAILSDTDGLEIRFTEDSGNTKSTGNTHEVYFFNGEDFQKVEEVDGAFPINSNGIYWTRTLNEDGTWTAQVLDLTQIDKSVPQAAIQFRESDSSLSWTAGKETSRSAPIVEVTINGYKVNAESGWSLSGVLPITCNGQYDLYAKDEADPAQSATATVTVTELKLTEADTCSFETTAAWNRTLDNGTVTADLNGMTGGTYVADISSPEDNEYFAIFKAALITGDYDPTEAESLEWHTFEPASAVYTWTGLEPGDYTLVICDSIDAENYMTKTLTVENKLLNATLTAKGVSNGFASDGAIIVAATGGNTEHVEFSLIPAPEGYQNGEEMDIRTFTAQPGVEWRLADPGADGEICTFEGLGTGYYFVAVRSSYAPDFTELDELAEALAVAKAALTGANASELDALNAEIEAAQQAYDAKAADIIAASSAAYEADPELWDCGLTLYAVVPATMEPTSHSNIVSITEDENGTTVITMKPGTELNEEDQKKVREANGDNDVKIVNGGATVLIKEGVICEDFDPKRLIADVSNAKEGMVVEYTDLDGNVFTDAFCIVTDGEASYIVLAEGDYRVVPAEAHFNDIEGLWGEDDIIFTALRDVFNGTGNGNFSPYKNMTRAMFVTVLWRMAGSPEPEGTATFEDLTADWYKKAVNWAYENEIVTGYSSTVFDPNREITREQMCVLLTRYMDWLDWPLTLTKEAKVFADADDIGKWAKDSVDACTQMGLINGVGDDRFAPKSSANRMQCSAILARYIRMLVEQYC